MPRLEKLLGVALLIGAGSLSVVLSALGIGIFLWGSTLRHPDPQGILLCLGPALSLPFFMTAIWSAKWHRRIMWSLAFASFLGVYAATSKMAPHEHLVPIEAAAIGFTLLRSPLVLLSILIAILIECSYWLRRLAGPRAEAEKR